MRILKSIFNPVLNSFGRTIGRILAYILIALLLMFIYNERVDAQSYTGLNTTLNTTYYDLFSGYIRNLNYNDNYVAFSYQCSTGSSYNNTCYALAYSNELTLENGIFTAPNVNLVKYDYLDGTRQLITETDTDFTFGGEFYYSNLGNSSSLEGGIGIYEKTIIFAVGMFFCFYIVRFLLSARS